MVEMCEGYSYTEDGWGYRPCMNRGKYDGKCHYHKDQKLPYSLYTDWFGKMRVGQKHVISMMTYAVPKNWFMAQRGSVDCVE